MNKNTVVISGGSSGLGLEIAKLLAKDDKTVVIVGRNAKKLINAKAEIEKAGGNCFICAADLSCDKGAKTVIEVLISEGLRCNLLINNAGSNARCDIDKIDSAHIYKALGDNCVSMALLTAQILPNMKNGDSIVNILSSASLRGNANEGAYCMAKWGARGYTLALKEAVKDKGINVLAVYPSGMQTPFWDECSDKPNTTNFMRADEVALAIVNAIPKNGDSFAIGELIIEKAK